MISKDVPLLGLVFPHPAMYITSPLKEFSYMNSKVGKQMGDMNSETNKITNIKINLFTAVRNFNNYHGVLKINYKDN